MAQTTKTIGIQNADSDGFDATYVELFKSLDPPLHLIRKRFYIS